MTKPRPDDMIYYQDTTCLNYPPKRCLTQRPTVSFKQLQAGQLSRLRRSSCRDNDRLQSGCLGLAHMCWSWLARVIGRAGQTNGAAPALIVFNPDNLQSAGRMVNRIRFMALNQSDIFDFPAGLLSQSAITQIYRPAPAYKSRILPKATLFKMMSCIFAIVAGTSVNSP